MNIMLHTRINIIKIEKKKIYFWGIHNSLINFKSEQFPPLSIGNEKNTPLLLNYDLNANEVFYCTRKGLKENCYKF